MRATTLGFTLTTEITLMRTQSTLTSGSIRKSRLLEGSILIALIIIALLFSVVPIAHADTTFGASATTANGELTTTLTWESTLASCEGSGHPAWDGPKATSGTHELPTIALSGTYTLTLTCSSPEDRTATLRWRNPTENTDGTPYTNPAGTKIFYGRADGELSNTISVMDPAATTYTIEDLAPGEWLFAVRAVNTYGVESALSSVKSKVTREGSTESESVTLTVNPVPAAAVLEAVE